MARLAYGGRKTREGTVVSDQTDKTVVVAVETSMRHRLYNKSVRRLRRYMIHDEANDAKLGDRVRIVESRRYSRKKRWQLAEVLVRADRPEVAAEEIDLELLGEVKVEEEEEEKAPPPEAAAPVEEVAAPEAKAEEAPPEAAPEEVPAVEEAVEPEAEAEPEAEEEPEPAEEPEADAEPEAEEEPEPGEEPETDAEPEAEEEPEPAEEPEAEGEEKEGSA